MNTYSPTKFPSPKDNIFHTVLKTNLLSQATVSQAQQRLFVQIQQY